MVREEHNTIGENMRQARLKVGWSQQDLAVNLGFAVASVSRWERGLAVPPVPTLRRVADALGVKLSTLIGD